MTVHQTHNSDNTNNEHANTDKHSGYNVKDIRELSSEVNHILGVLTVLQRPLIEFGNNKLVAGICERATHLPSAVFLCVTEIIRCVSDVYSPGRVVCDGVPNVVTGEIICH